MQDIIIIAVILIIIAAVILYIYKAKKRGEHCIGCPCSGKCGKKCQGHSAKAHQDDR